MKDNTRRITVAAMFAALAFAVAALFNIVPITLVPSLPFLQYDPKDILIALCGFILGPLYAACTSLVAAVIELSVSSTGLIGALMNFLSSCIFACSAAVVYKRIRNVYGAVLGLVAAIICTTGFMLGWNYLITPLYMGISRAAVAEMLIPAFLPFNLIKYSLSAGATLLVYKPIITTLRTLGLVEKKNTAVTVTGTVTAFAIGGALMLMGVAAVLILQ